VPFLRSRQLCSYSRTSERFMEPESLLPCSQEPSTGPHSELDQSRQYHPIVRSILISSTHLRLGLPSGPFPSGFPINILHTFIFSPFVLHVLPISSSLAWSFYTWRRVQVTKSLSRNSLVKLGRKWKDNFKMQLKQDWRMWSGLHWLRLGTSRGRL
jgi:hypothetical protein